jgi:hypothetical protein
LRFRAELGVETHGTFKVRRFIRIVSETNVRNFGEIASKIARISDLSVG